MIIGSVDKTAETQDIRGYRNLIINELVIKKEETRVKKSLNKGER